MVTVVSHLICADPMQANKHFDKEAALREAENVVKAQKAAYNKDDFFDMMSCETLDKMGQGGDSMQQRRTMQVSSAVRDAGQPPHLAMM